MASPDSSRVRRFALPELHDERAGDVIEAFLDGRHARRGRPNPKEEGHHEAPTPLAGLVTRVDWTEALKREAARSRRYRRPASVLVLAARPSIGTTGVGQPPDSVAEWMNRVATPIAHVLRRGIRSSDLATRTGEARFQLLLPESTELAAATLAERLVADCEVWLAATGAPIAVDAAVVALSPDVASEATVASAWGLINRGPAAD